jgi:hypothetical protein
MKRTRQILLFFLALFYVVAATAQDFGALATSMPKMKAVFSKLLADTPEFSASSVVELLNTNGVLQMKLPINFALTADRMRQEVDVMGMNLPQTLRDTMQKGHLDKIVIITQTDTRKIFLLFPGLQAYASYLIPDEVLEEITARGNQVDVQRKEFADEMVETHPCLQVRLIFNEPNRPSEVALLRCAKDLRMFPIRMILLTPSTTTKFAFEDVSLKRPEANLFQVPTNYVEFPDSAAVSRYAMGKMQENGANPLK